MFGFSLILQKWPRALHFNFWVRAQRKTAQNGPKSAFFKYLLISHPKVENAWNKCPFHHFGGMLAWKSGLSFWIPTLKVPFLGPWIWALSAILAKSAHIRVPKNATLSVGIQKLRPLFHANIPPKLWNGHLFHAFFTFGWEISKYSKNALFGPFWAVFLWARTQKLKCKARGHF